MRVLETAGFGFGKVGLEDQKVKVVLIAWVLGWLGRPVAGPVLRHKGQEKGGWCRNVKLQRRGSGCR